jgi:two-component system, LytTR family, response regulator
LPSQVLRVHKSYIVSTNKVVSIEGNQLEIGKHKVAVSREKREMIIERIFGNI